MVDINLAISNKYINKQEINLALIYALKALDYAHQDFRKARTYINIAGVYAWNANYITALQYLRKYDDLGSYPHFTLFRNMMYGMAFNGLAEPDSALVYLLSTETIFKKRPDVFGYAQALNQFAKAYEIKGDSDLAIAYYKKTLAFCEQNGVGSFYIIACNNYCKLLISMQNYNEAKRLAHANLITATRGGNFYGVSLAAQVLQQVYGLHNTDSAYHFALMQIAYQDSANSLKKIHEFQNITFAQQLREIDEQAKSEVAALQRKQNIQYGLIALCIVSLIFMFLILSRTIITNPKIIRFISALALLIVFEFLNLLLHPLLEKITHHTPVLMLLGLVCIAFLLVPMHHKIEKWATDKLIEKNKQIRLAQARKTIVDIETEN
ncbi:MAG TPA: hypothetical protein PLO59_03575 [Bacteroidia bacterium]|nr:hypothetical protein [Bacteroidia bacterium]